VLLRNTRCIWGCNITRRDYLALKFNGWFFVFYKIFIDFSVRWGVFMTPEYCNLYRFAGVFGRLLCFCVQVICETNRFVITFLFWYQYVTLKLETLRSSESRQHVTPKKTWNFSNVAVRNKTLACIGHGLKNRMPSSSIKKIFKRPPFFISRPTKTVLSSKTFYRNSALLVRAIANVFITRVGKLKIMALG
jgi:hypothetical protein